MCPNNARPCAARRQGRAPRPTPPRCRPPAATPAGPSQPQPLRERKEGGGCAPRATLRSSVQGSAWPVRRRLMSKINSTPNLFATCTALRTRLQRRQHAQSWQSPAPRMVCPASCAPAGMTTPTINQQTKQNGVQRLAGGKKGACCAFSSSFQTTLGQVCSSCSAAAVHYRRGTLPRPYITAAVLLHNGPGPGSQLLVRRSLSATSGLLPKRAANKEQTSVHAQGDMVPPRACLRT